MYSLPLISLTLVSFIQDLIWLYASFWDYTVSIALELGTLYTNNIHSEDHRVHEFLQPHASGLLKSSDYVAS